jgi:nucleoside-diphosphate-sugar epimerase
MTIQSVLVTGGAGYVGSGLLRALLAEGYGVVCVDRLSFGGESLLDIWHHPRFEFHKCDIGDASAIERVLRSRPFHGIVHLAAVVGDPACARDPEDATRTNWEASKRLVDLAREVGVPRFIFASTCSNYGKMPDPTAYVDETSQLAPVSLYAELKVKFERYLLEELPKSDAFCPTALRFSTVYGASPRMRFDLTVNEFTKDLAIGKGLRIFGEQFWRPYCHVRDFARAFITVLKAPASLVAYDVFNVGDTRENYTKRMLLDELVKIFPEAKIEYVQKNEDPRDYRVNSDKIKRVLGFEISVTVPEGMREIADIVRSGVISDPENQRHYNIPYVGKAS